MGKVMMEAGSSGRHIRTVPSQEEDRKVSLATKFQCTEKTSRACSDHACTGNWASSAMSKSLMLPSPEAARI